MGRLARILTLGEPEGRPSRWRRLLGVSFGLPYLLYPISDVLSGTVAGAAALWRLVALAGFVAGYLAIVLVPAPQDDRTRWTFPLLGLTTAMVAVFPLLFGGGWLALPIYLAVSYGFVLPAMRALAAVAGMATVVLVDGLVIDADAGTVSLLVLQVLTLGVLFISMRNTRMLVVQLREAQDEVARLAAAEERLRIARDLHDLLGHSLSVIVLKSELAGRLVEQGYDRVAREVADIELVARQALVEVREAVTGYRRRRLSEELDGVRSALAVAGIALTMRTSGTPLPDALDGLFGWVVREAVTNVVRHARATRCQIDVSYGDAGAVLEVADDGRAGTYRPGSGLTGLTERVGAAGGSVQVDRTSAGFRLRVVVPAQDCREGGRPMAGELSALRGDR